MKTTLQTNLDTRIEKTKNGLTNSIADETKNISSIPKVEELRLQLSTLLELDEIESDIHLNLLRMGPTTASLLAKEIHIDRTKAYRIIEKLLSMKIVSTTLSRPKLCVANNPSEVLKYILETKEEQVHRIKTMKDVILNKINQTIPTNCTTTLPKFHVIQGTINIYRDIEKSLESATDIVYIVTTLKDLAKMYHSNIPEKIKSCESNGGQVRLLTEFSDHNLISYVSRFNASITKVTKLHTASRIVVKKNKEVIISNVATDNPESDYAFCTNASEIVNSIFELCELLWKSANILKMFMK